MHSRILRFAFVGPVLLLLFMISAGTAGAASKGHPVINRNLYAVPRNSTVHISPAVLNMSGGGTHYLYVDDGTCPDSIDVYQTGTTLTHVGNYPNDGCTSIAYYGASSLAVAKGNSSHGNCLTYADSSGFVDSFVINSDGSLGAEVSHLATHSGGFPSNIGVALNGTVYETNPGYDLESYSLGSGCALTYLQSTTASSQLYISVTLIGNTLAAADSNSGNIDSYHLGAGGAMTEINSVAGQIAFPDTVAYEDIPYHGQTLYRLFTGQATANPPQVQGSRYQKVPGKVTFLGGSPATDPSGSNGAAVTVDETTKVLIQGEQYTSTLANYNVKGPSMSFMTETPMAVFGAAPSIFVQLSTTLFVDTVFNGDLEACTLGSGGASGCMSVAVLTSTGGVSAGLAIM